MSALTKTRKLVRARWWMGVLAVGFAVAGCEREDRPSPSPTSAPADTGRVEFPASLRADDPQVNDFLFTAIGECIEGDYEAFRLLWSVHEEPLGRAEFERGWRAVHKVRVDKLVRMKTEEGNIVYVVAAHVELDPDEVPEPVRDLVLLLVEESGQWRLATPPRSVRKAMKGETEAEGDTDTAPPEEVNTGGQAARGT